MFRFFTYAILFLSFTPYLLAQEFEELHFPINKINLSYVKEHPDLPEIDNIREKATSLLVSENGVVDSPALKKKNGTAYTFDSAPSGKYTVGAINALCSDIVKHFNDQLKISNVLCVPAPGQFSDFGDDLRKSKSLDLVVSVGLVTNAEVKFTSKKQSWRQSRLKKRILALSPIKPTKGSPAFLREDSLNDYLGLLNRHRVRNVSLLIEQDSKSQNDSILSYVVNEKRPWHGSIGISNNGTPSTDEWRESFSFTHNQLTGRDDILTLNYSTTSFDEVHAIDLSYDTPLPDSLHWRLRNFASWNTYNASVLGFASNAFEGKGWTLGTDLSYLLHKDKKHELELLMGLKFHHVETTNNLAFTEGSADFLLAHVGLRGQHKNVLGFLSGNIDLAYNLSSLAGSSTTDIVSLGRIDPDDDFALFTWRLNQHINIDTLFDETKSTSYNQLTLSFSGQSSFGSRLAPQYTAVLGGIGTIRGYPQAELSGDNYLKLSADYRYSLSKHLLKDTSIPVLKNSDVTLRSFVDYGLITQSSPVPAFEQDSTLLGVGLGLDFLYNNNYNFSLDWGTALHELPTVAKGSSQVHLSFHYSF